MKKYLTLIARLLFCINSSRLLVKMLVFFFFAEKFVYVFVWNFFIAVVFVTFAVFLPLSQKKKCLHIRRKKDFFPVIKRMRFLFHKK